MADQNISTPATDKNTGITRWTRFGTLHREDGPAIEHPDGSNEWLLNGKHHRLGGPAVTRVIKNRRGQNRRNEEQWFFHGQLHREDGPAITYSSGGERWYLKGQLHRVGGPASTVGEGQDSVPTRRWYQEGKLHREDGPAVEDDEGTQLYYRDGKLHREDGPARILPNYRQQDYWLNGNRVTGEQFVARQQKAEPKSVKPAKAEPKPERMGKEAQVIRPLPTPKVQQPVMAEQGGFGF